MSLIKRLFGNPAPATSPPAAMPAAEPKPRPDLAALSREEEAAVAAAIAAPDTQAIGRWVLEGSSTRVRQMAAEAVTDPGQLGELIRATRGGKDKSVYRILTANREAALAEERRKRAVESEVAAAASAVARLADRACDDAYTATVFQVEARWREVAGHATDEQQAEVAAQLARAHARIEQHRIDTEAAAARTRAAALALAEQQRRREAEAAAAAAAAAAQASARDAAQQAERAAARAQREAADAAVHELISLLRQAQAALDHGGTARAARLRDDIKARLPSAPALPPWFERKLAEVDARIEDLKDWKTFTVVPKRAELLARMQSLVGAEMSPEELAKHIRHLRDEWRSLNRGAAVDPSPEWQRFDELATRAYEPCREHFARQGELRRANQAKREELLARLAEYSARQSAEEPNLREVQQVIAEARREWQEYAPVDQAVAHDLQARLRAALDGLQARLDGEYARHVQEKRTLIARAAELAGLDDLRAAIEETKALQRAWKTVGPVPRHHDQALWEEFRRNCDTVFERSSQQYAAHGAALQAGESRAVALCEALERIASATGDELAAGLAQVAALRDEFATLELPRASARDLRQRLTRAAGRCEQAARERRTAEARRGRDELHAAAAQLRAYALAVARGRDAQECGELQAAAAEALARLAHAPKGGRALLEQELARITAGEVSRDLAANESALRLLCVRAELAADAETPPEDLELRRAYQMQRLMESMGQGERATPAALDELALQWLTSGPVEPAVHDALYARFDACRQAFDRSTGRNRSSA